MPTYKHRERNKAIVKLWNEGRTAIDILQELEGTYAGLTAPAVRGIVKRSPDAERRAGGPKVKRKGKRPQAKPRKRKTRKATPAPVAGDKGPRGGKRTVRDTERGRERRMTLWLPEDLFQAVRLRAVEEWTSQSAVVEGALRALFKRKPPVP